MLKITLPWANYNGQFGAFLFADSIAIVDANETDESIARLNIALTGIKYEKLEGKTKAPEAVKAPLPRPSKAAPEAPAKAAKATTKPRLRKPIPNPQEDPIPADAPTEISGDEELTCNEDLGKEKKGGTASAKTPPAPPVAFGPASKEGEAIPRAQIMVQPQEAARSRIGRGVLALSGRKA